MSDRVRVTAPHVLVGAVCTGLAGALLVEVRSTPLLALAGALAVVALAAERGRTIPLALALAAVAWWWGSVRLEQLHESALVERIGTAAPARVEVTGPTRRSEFALRVPVRVIRFGDDVIDEPARLELPTERAPPQGAILELVAFVRAPRPGDAPGEFDEAAYLRREGVHVVLRAGAFEVVDRRGGIGGIADALRRRLAASIAPGVGGERRAVVAGVVLGEDEGLERDLRDDFRASGLYHLLAVSGQNVAYVVWGSLLLAWAAGVPRWAGHVAALVAVGGYVLAVGWQPSIVRAGVAGALASLAWIASRPGDRWYFLLVGAALLLAVNPYNLLAPGFQLSFAAVAAIFLAVPGIERRLEGYPLPTKLVAIVAVSTGCGIATAPILWLHFGEVPLYSVAANALAAPAVAPLLGLALAAAALEPVLPSAASGLAWGNGWLAAYVAWCARLVGGLPHAQATSASALALVGVATIVVAIAVRVRPPRGRRVVAVAAMAVALGLGWRLWAPDERAPPPPTGLRVTFLDVGQGDAILVQVPQGAVLVDQGPPEADVAGQLEELDVERLAALVLTHPQRDHVGGAADVLEEHAVGMTLDAGLAAGHGEVREALAVAEERDVPVVVARAGRAFRLGLLRLEVLWPEDAGTPDADPNARAIVLLASYGSIDALLTADAESDVTVSLRPPPVEILKVAHHGSADERLDELLALVRPRVAVISVGARNDYGHPDPETVATLERFPSLSLYRTDEDGRVVVESDGRTLSVTTER